MGNEPHVFEAGRAPVWNPAFDEILKSGAADGPSRLRRAIDRVRHLDPELSELTILKRTAELNLTRWKRPWTEQDRSFVLDHAREFSVADIARRLGRTPRAVYQLLWRSRESAKFQDGYTRSELAQALHVSPRKVRQWVHLGWIILYQGRVKDRSLQRFLEGHSDEIDATRLEKDLLLWLRDLGLQEAELYPHRPHHWLSSRRQSLKVYDCRRCGRKVRGNAFHRHLKVCIKRVCPTTTGLRDRRLN